jgi:2-phosphosulfolactate phosphatase
VVIDVLRAFTTAAYAAQAGAGPIVLAGDVAAAVALRSSVARAFVLSDGPRREGVDLVNSPALIRSAPVAGRPLIMTTTNGTRAALEVDRDALLLCASFVNARATATLVRDLGLELEVVSSAGPEADEDVACGEFVTALVQDPSTAVEPFLERVRRSAARAVLDRRVSEGDTGVHPDDVELCLQADAGLPALVGVRVLGTVMLLPSHGGPGGAFNC